MLFQIFNKAVANDLLNKNPAAYADKMRKARPKPKEAFTTREVQLLLDKLPQDKIGWSIRLMLGTGMRTQELLALEPRYIAEDGSAITIEQAVVMEKGTAKIGTPKSFDSYRCIPVPENLRCYAVLLRDRSDKFIWESPRKPGMPCNPSTFRTQFQKAVKGGRGGSGADASQLPTHLCFPNADAGRGPGYHSEHRRSRRAGCHIPEPG